MSFTQDASYIRNFIIGSSLFFVWWKVVLFVRERKAIFWKALQVTLFTFPRRGIVPSNLEIILNKLSSASFTYQMISNIQLLQFCKKGFAILIDH